MANVKPQSKLKSQLFIAILGLLTLPIWEKRIRGSNLPWCQRWLKTWDEEPLSTREGWNRFWSVILLTTISFFAIATIEQAIKLNIKTPQTNEQVQAVNKPEDCPVKFSFSGIYCLVIKSELLQLAETFSIVVAAWVFILDRRDRKEQAEREYWSLIDGARDSETSGARYSAITRLHQEKVSLKGLDAEGADLQGINLSGANLERSNLQQADLEKAILIKVNLQKANLQDANLKEANLQEAELWQADLRGANLRGADLSRTWLAASKLHRAVLRNANLEEADLRGSRFYDVDFRGANLRNADLAAAKFVRVRNLKLEQIKEAPNWQDAQFSQEWYPDETDVPRKADKYIVPNSNEATNALDALNKLREIENLIDSLAQKRYMSPKEFNDYLESLEFDIPEVNNLKELILFLEDTQDRQKL